MKMPTVHFLGHNGYGITLCGRSSWRGVTWYEPKKVSCGTCRRALGLKKKGRRS